MEANNNAKLREAALAIRADILKRRSENCWYATDSDILEKIDAALAVPPRNCDVGTPEEQKQRYDSYCFSRGCGNCPLFDEEGCNFAWAQMPYEEGGAR